MHFSHYVLHKIPFSILNLFASYTCTPPTLTLRCNNCLQCLAIFASCLNMCIDFEGDDAVVFLINTAADITFCCVSGCMTARTYHEMKVREKEAPDTFQMQR